MGRGLKHSIDTASQVSCNYRSARYHPSAFVLHIHIIIAVVAAAAVAHDNPAHRSLGSGYFFDEQTTASMKDYIVLCFRIIIFSCLPIHLHHER